jgi:hypothetical protein
VIRKRGEDAYALARLRETNEPAFWKEPAIDAEVAGEFSEISLIELTTD